MIRSGWWVVARSDRLRDRPLRVELFGIPLVAFRTSTEVAVLDDRCAHRNAPLSLGKVRPNGIECPYHGWRFDALGVCKEIPHAVSPGEKPSRIRSWKAKESQGYLFVSHDGAGEPHVFSSDHRSRARWSFEAPACMDLVLENQLDVTHTSVLHTGFFRNQSQRRKIRAIVQRDFERVEVRYIGEERPSGIVAKLLAPRARTVEHVDRLILPGITEVEYTMGSAHFRVTTFLTPVHENRTLCHAEVHFDLWLPSFVIAPFLWLGAKTILEQDLRILRAQQDNLDRFEKRSFSSSYLDFYDGFVRANILGETLRKPPPSREEAELWI